MKRRRDHLDVEHTPRKRKSTGPDESDDEITSNVATPTKTLNRTPSKSALATRINGVTNGTTTPKSQRKVNFSTPTKVVESTEAQGTPTLVRNADRSARRKTARRMMERNIAGDQSDDDAELEDELSRQIFGGQSDEEDGGAGDNGTQEEAPLEPQTPTKRGRGRPKGSKNRTPSPPPNMVSHEQYFWQNKLGVCKTSNNTLPSHILLNHDEFAEQTAALQDRHAAEKEFLLDLHSNSFDQWDFELSNGFNLLLHGYGSKRAITERYAEHIYANQTSTTASTPKKQQPRIAIINAYTPSLTIRDVLNIVAEVIIPTTHKLPTYRIANTASTLVQTLADLNPTTPVTLLINSLDAPPSPFRRQANLAILATLASSAHIHLVATADTATFPLLFDLSLRTQFNWLFHDCTTFAGFGGVEIDVVESVNELLGRGGRRIGGKDGVAYVLKSLPENAKGVFRILLAEQLAGIAEDGDDVQQGEDEDELLDGAGNAARKVDGGDSAAGAGVEYRLLYHKALEELLCTNEMSFRTLLKEFHDHRMVESKRDIGGTERLVIPFRREDLEGLLEELA